MDRIRVACIIIMRAFSIYNDIFVDRILCDSVRFF